MSLHASDIGHWLGMTVFCVYRTAACGQAALRNMPVPHRRAGCPHPAACETDGFGKHPYCAFNLTGRTIYKKLSLPSVGVITQGEILVFRAKRTVSAGAYRSASMR